MFRSGPAHKFRQDAVDAAHHLREFPFKYAQANADLLRPAPELRSDRRRAIPFNNLRLRHDVQSRAKRIEELEEFTDASRLLSALKLGNVPRPSSRKASKRILRNLLFLADVAHLNADVSN